MKERKSTERLGSAAVVLAVLLATPGFAVAVEPPSIDELIDQIENRSCAYSDDVYKICERSETGTSWLGRLLFRSHGAYSCVLGAARCLEQLGPKAAPAVPSLIRALRQGPNNCDTGDGVIATRSAVASALGAIGDPRAIDPLAEALAAARPADRSWSAVQSTEPAAVREILSALGRFGPEAARHWGRIAAVLETRNADTGFFERRRFAFEQSEAMRLASEKIKLRTQNATRYVVPWDAVDAARARIDRSSADYVRGLERSSQDSVATAAADALGKLRAREATVVLRKTLANRCAAAAAANALAQLNARDGETIGDLERVLGDGDLGPATRGAAARALGALGAVRSVAPLSKTLRAAALREASAEALGAIGADAAPALPELLAILREPSLSVRDDRGIRYSIEAGRRMSERIAAARAVARIAGDRAPAVLCPYASDVDVGHVIRRELGRGGCSKTPVAQRVSGMNESCGRPAGIATAGSSAAGVR